MKNRNRPKGNDALTGYELPCLKNGLQDCFKSGLPSAAKIMGEPQLGTGYPSNFLAWLGQPLISESGQDRGHGKN